MRELSIQQITETVKQLCIEANCYLPADMKHCIESGYAEEPWPQAREILERIVENYQIAERENRPVCQDTGLACVFISVGQDVHIEGNLTEAVNEGVRQGYMESYLRKSVVRDPLDRVNTCDNTPAMVYYDIVPGDKVEIIVAPKGAGSENMSQIKMLKPSDGVQGVKGFILKVVEEAGPNPCPPIVVGVGVGGTFDVRASDINEEMKMAAAMALANLISDEELNEDYIIPAAFDERVGPAVAKAVAEAARRTGVARI